MGEDQTINRDVDCAEVGNHPGGGDASGTSAVEDAWRYRRVVLKVELFNSSLQQSEAQFLSLFFMFSKGRSGVTNDDLRSNSIKISLILTSLTVELSFLWNSCLFFIPLEMQRRSEHNAVD